MYATTDDVRLAVTVPSAQVTDMAIQSFILYAEREIDRETFTTYWQSQTTGTATSASSTSLTDSSAIWTENQFENCFVKITGGTGSGQIRAVLSGNTPTSLSVDRAWTVTPDATSTYQIYYSATPAYVSDTFDGNNMNWWFVPQYPVQTIESLSINSQTVTPANVSVYKDSGKLYLGTSCELRYFDAKQPKLINLAYWWGVNGVPMEIKRFVVLKAAIQSLIVLKSSAYNTPMSYSMPEGSVSMKAPTDAIQSTIDSYNQELEYLSSRLIRYPSLG
jgi:hypothetical protein